MASRRRFTPEYKLRILHEAEQCREPGELSALLRRERLYSSYLTAWRRQRRQGALKPLAGEERKPPHRVPSFEQLLEENRRLKSCLGQVEQINDIHHRLARITRALLREGRTEASSE